MKILQISNTKNIWQLISFLRMRDLLKNFELYFEKFRIVFHKSTIKAKRNTFCTTFCTLNKTIGIFYQALESISSD